MYAEPSKLPASLALSQFERKASTQSFQVLTDEFEKAMGQLREEIVTFNGVLAPALRPEPATCTKDELCTEPARAPLESWLVAQLSVARSCIERLQSYRERCVL